MKFKKQRFKLPIKKFEYEGGCMKKKHGPLFPDNLRGLVVAPSNGGKTNLLLSLLIDKNGLKFRNVYLFTKTQYQPKYEYLEKVLGRVKGIGFFRFQNEFLKPEEVERNSTCIFDDVITEKQGVIQQFFCMGRHRGLDVIYLSQSYSRVPKQLIRENANFVVLFKIDEMSLKHCFTDYVSSDMSFQRFQELCSECWKQPYGFLVISLEDARDNGRYRLGIDNYIKP